MFERHSFYVEPACDQTPLLGMPSVEKLQWMILEHGGKLLHQCKESTDETLLVAHQWQDLTLPLTEYSHHVLVSPWFVVQSISCGRLLDLDRYIVPLQVPVLHCYTIWTANSKDKSIIEQNGGVHVTEWTDTITHLLGTNLLHPFMDRARKERDLFPFRHILRPQWLQDVTQSGRRNLPTLPYQLLEEDVTKPDSPLLSPCHELLNEMIFYFSPVDPQLQCNLQHLQQEIKKRGGQIENDYTERVTHVIVHIQNELFHQAIADGKQVGTLLWVTAMLTDRVKCSQLSSVLYYPRPYLILPQIQELQVTITGYRSLQRSKLHALLAITGIPWTPHLTSKHTHLISAGDDSEKETAAKQMKNCAIIRHWWLEECLQQNQILPVTNRFTCAVRDVSVGKTPVLLKRMENGKIVPYFGKPDPIKEEKYDDALPISKKEKEIVPLPEGEQSRETSPVNEEVNEANETKRKKKKSPVQKRQKKRAYRILFTALQPSKADEKQLTRLGATIISDIYQCTHLITERVARTEKFLMAMSLAPFIVTRAWIDASAKAGHFLEEEPFLLQDPLAEAKFNFQLKSSLIQASRHRLFESLSFYISAHCQPEPQILQRMIEAAGGKVIKSVTSSETVVVLHEQDQNDLIRYKQSHRCVTTEFILTGLLQQSIDFENHAFPWSK